MAFIEVMAGGKPQQVRVCDWCRTCCIPSGRFCSGRCAMQSHEHTQSVMNATMADLIDATEAGAEAENDAQPTMEDLGL